MAFRNLFSFSIFIAFITVFLTPPIRRFITVVGVFRRPFNTKVADTDFIVIKDAMYCEDLHRHSASGLIFTACDGSNTTRFSWFPALGTLGDPLSAKNSRGSIHVIDPKTFTSRRLQFENFDQPFVTHGIDIWADEDNTDEVYIFAVNHLPHPTYLQHVSDGKHPKDFPRRTPKSRSQIEIFQHSLGTSTIKHIRSVWHSDIKTPNDILALSPTTFYVTNDHYYREGHLRELETAYFGAKWSNTVFVNITDMSATEPNSGIQITEAISGLHNNNGLGWGRSKNEMAIISASSGILHLARISDNGQAPNVQITEAINVDSSIDNPSFYSDPFAEVGCGDSSGFVLAGLTRGIDFPKTVGDPLGANPSMIWLVKPGYEDGNNSLPKWEKKPIFEDDGQRLRTSASAVLVGIDPELEAGKKKAWLLATGFYAPNVIAVKIDL